MSDRGPSKSSHIFTSQQLIVLFLASRTTGWRLSFLSFSSASVSIKMHVLKQKKKANKWHTVVVQFSLKTNMTFSKPIKVQLV